MIDEEGKGSFLLVYGTGTQAKASVLPLGYTPSPRRGTFRVGSQWKLPAGHTSPSGLSHTLPFLKNPGNFTDEVIPFEMLPSLLPKFQFVL